MMQGPPLTFILPYRPENVSPVSLHPTKLVNHADSPEVSPLLNFCRSSPSLSLTLRREFELGGGGSQEEPSCRKLCVLWCVGGLTSWRAASKKAGLRAKLKLLPLLCMLSSFLTRPQSTLTPHCKVHTVHWNRPVSASICMCFGLHADYSHVM